MLQTRVVIIVRVIRWFLAPAMVALSIAADGSQRFTQSLTPAERQEVGLDKLSSDQAAVIDAMIRREASARLASGSGNARTAKPGDSKAASDSPRSLSQRLTADERRLAGLDTLTADQVSRIDALAERYVNGSVARTLLAPPTYVSRYSRVKPEETERERKIHGSFSLSYGWGKGGYSERTGAMVLNYDDPDGRYSVTVSYAETHVKAPEGYGVYREVPPYRP